MATVSYIAEHRAFIARAIDERMSFSERALWEAIFTLMNEKACGADWPDGFISLDNLRVMLYMGTRSLSTLQNARNGLKQRGLIDYKSGKRREAAPMYKLNYLTVQEPGFAPGFTPKKGAKHGAITGAITGAKPVTYNQTIDLDIDTDSFVDEEDADDDRHACARVAAGVYPAVLGREATPAEAQVIANAAIGANCKRLIAPAIERASAAGARNVVRYVCALFRDWRAAWVRTAEDLGAYEYDRDCLDGRRADRDDLTAYRAYTAGIEERRKRYAAYGEAKEG